jgi:hypothetical protein
LGEHAGLAEKISAELRKEFPPAIALIILNAAENAADRSEKSLRTRQANWQRQQVAMGNCPQCGAKCDFNKKTRKPYKFCAACRKKSNPKQAALMRSRRGIPPNDAACLI